MTEAQVNYLEKVYHKYMKSNQNNDDRFIDMAALADIVDNARDSIKRSKHRTRLQENKMDKK